MNNWMRKSSFIFGVATGLALSLPVSASVLDYWAADGWTVFANDDVVGANGHVGPGGGGQPFDAEYLFYKTQGDVLSVGLQTGFDLSDGHQLFNGTQLGSGSNYYAGDLAIGFNGGGYEYAIDFGLVTKNSHGTNVGNGTGNQDAAGLYKVTDWNNEIYFGASSPFAMDEGVLVASTTGTSGSDGTSYYRTASFDLTALGFDVKSISAHWTMSCGNDVIEGSTPVPEPSALLLMAGGLFGLIGGRKLKGRGNKA